jgi:hypothetical protein
MTAARPRVGIFRDCNYPLRDLPQPRCPECGRAFDPHDPGMMLNPRMTRVGEVA